MKQTVVVMDQTVNEALRLGGQQQAVKLIVSILRKYPIGAIDLSWRQLEKNDLSFQELHSLNLLRCWSDSSGAAIAQIRRRGFSKIIITWRHQQSGPPPAQLAPALAAARGFSHQVGLCIENLADLSAAEIQEYLPLLTHYQVDRLIYSDRGGRADPFALGPLLQALQRQVPCEIEFHGNNGLGLATANSLAALRSGIHYVAAAVGGIGVPGQAALEEVLMAVKHLWKQDQQIDGTSLAADCERILSSLHIALPVDKAIIGRDVFAHESGIHVDGVNKNPAIYEVIQPEEVGLKRRIVIGKHSGTASLKYKFKQWNIELADSVAAEMLEKVRTVTMRQKSPLSD